MLVCLYQYLGWEKVHYSSSHLVLVHLLFYCLAYVKNPCEKCHMDFKTYACLTHPKLPAREKSLSDIYCFQIGFYLCQLIQGLLPVAQPSTLVNYLGEVSKMHWFHFMCHTTIRRLLTQVSNLSCRCFSVH